MCIVSFSGGHNNNCNRHAHNTTRNTTSCKQNTWYTVVHGVTATTVYFSPLSIRQALAVPRKHFPTCKSSAKRIEPASFLTQTNNSHMPVLWQSSTASRVAGGTMHSLLNVKRAVVRAQHHDWQTENNAQHTQQICAIKACCVIALSALLPQSMLPTHSFSSASLCSSHCQQGASQYRIFIRPSLCAL
jgi:hypothetical protein